MSLQNPSYCKYCQKYFCYKHRIPERHNCEYFPNIKKKILSERVYFPGFQKARVTKISSKFLYPKKGNLDEKLINLKEQLKIHSDQKDKYGEANILSEIGSVLCKKGDFEDALIKYQNALTIYKELGNDMDEALVLTELGLIYLEKKDFDSASKYQQKALKIYKQIKNRKGEASILFNIGGIYEYKNDELTALKYYEEALEIHRETKDFEGEAQVLAAIAATYHNMNESEAALNYLKDSLRIYRELGKKEGELSCLGNIGIIYLGGDEFTLALKYCREALKIIQELGIKEQEVILLNTIGSIYQRKRDWPKALKNYQDGLKISRKEGYADGEALLLMNTGITYAQMGDFTSASGKLLSAHKKFEAIDNYKAAGYALSYYFKYLFQARDVRSKKSFNKEKFQPTKAKKEGKSRKPPRPSYRGGKIIETPSKTSSQKKSSGKKITPWIAQALEHKSLGKYKKAIEGCENALEKDPTNSQAWKLLGELYVEIGEYLKADECFKKIKNE
ncbi:MAG: tetratricopeptide repeat protein [Candidatus Helarchaeota archaeon]|nr:tetratricopeptide repeat protein [Candidatus Helarchaeota archaeon]